MGSSNALEDAAARLMAALDAVEDKFEDNLKEEHTIEELRGQVKSLIAEREQLFATVERERRRADRLESANEEVSDRLGSVIDSVRMIVQTN